MMKLGIMQPYFFPYIGYWQLMNAVDRYVIFDDVHYINRGWINRNRILIQGVPHYINLPLRKASQNKIINEIQIQFDEKFPSKVLKTIIMAYGHAPQFGSVFPIVQEILLNREENLALFLKNQIVKIASYLEIKTRFDLSSELEQDRTLKGQDRILALCGLLGASSYYNTISGKELYKKEAFEQQGIQLRFVQTNPISYKQDTEIFQKDLSILDVLMYNPVEEVRRMLEEYTLI